MLACLSAPASGAAQESEVRAALREAGGDREVAAFYRARGGAPLWFADGTSRAAGELLSVIENAEADGLDPGDYRPRRLIAALEKAEGGDAEALSRAELLLSRTFASFVRDARRIRDATTVYADEQLRPVAPGAHAALNAAADAPDLAAYVAATGWMHPIYARLRAALVDAGAGESERFRRSSPELRLLRLNLDRARTLPVTKGRYVLVDAAAARLWMYDGGRVRDTMRVVVGKPDEPTPMMAGLIRYASVNPYWNIPPDLVRKRVVPGAQEQGAAFFRAKRYEVLSGWSENARVVPPMSVDWSAVADGSLDARVRQLPGPGNAMGRVKFMFPNRLGIYLHDTPEKSLLREDGRLFSSGCVRVEDAARLGRWLMGRPLLPAKSARPEQRVDLPVAVPVYITYLTAAPEGERIAFRNDVYARDEVQLAGR